MITSILDCLRAFLRRKSSRFQPDESEPPMTAEEHAAIMKALNPDCRVYIRSGSGKFMDVGWNEEGEQEITWTSARETPRPFQMQIEIEKP